MATNDFKPFAVGSNANVTSQSDYEALAALASGFQAGKASSAQVNKALRQGTVMASALAKYITDSYGVDVLDDGDVSTLASKIAEAIKARSKNSFLQIENQFSEIAALGTDYQKKARVNLGLDSGSLATSGWRKNSDGSIEQWGIATTGNDGSVRITFPVPFVNGCYNVLSTISSTSVTPANNVSFYPPTTTEFTMFSSSPSGQGVSGTGFHWRAFGL